MVSKFEFLLTAKENCLLPSFTGSLVRGAFLSLIKSKDSILSDKLHEGNKKRPFSLTPVFRFNESLARTRRGEIVVKKNEKYFFRLGVLTEELADLIETIALAALQSTIELAANKFTLLQVSREKKTTKDLLLTNELLPEIFSLVFKSPTYLTINATKFPLRFPDSRYVFMNLAKLWNIFNNDQTLIDEDDFFGWLGHNVSVNAHKLKTQLVYTAPTTKKIGFKGWVRYKLSDNLKYRSWVHLLAQYAEFSNVGGNRTAGLGYVEYLKEK
ncbi:MAG: CRISPR system precrRNA processing endoribonuclease RAMP protein Cas6 [Candidatus Heimdallarchaeaceae archaeon]